MNGGFQRKYGVEATINFELFEVDGVDFRVDAVYTSGDVKIMKDEGAEANTVNSFTDEGQGYSIVLTATEMQAARIVLYFVDQTGTKVWLDRILIIETYGHANAQHPFLLATSPGNTLDVAATGEAGIDFDNAKGSHPDIDLNADQSGVTIGTTNLNTDMVTEPPTAVQNRQEMDSNSTKLSSIETDTQDIQSRIPAALANGRMSSDEVAISGSTDAADKLKASAKTIVIGTAITGTLSDSEMTTDLTETRNDQYNGRRLIFTSGILKDLGTAITDYDGATKKLTFVAANGIPSNGDGFNIV